MKNRSDQLHLSSYSFHIILTPAHKIQISGNVFITRYYILKRCSTRASEPIHVILFVWTVDCFVAVGIQRPCGWFPLMFPVELRNLSWPFYLFRLSLVVRHFLSLSSFPVFPATSSAILIVPLSLSPVLHTSDLFFLFCACSLLLKDIILHLFVVGSFLSHS
jgi:hypothetical protein